MKGLPFTLSFVLLATACGDEPAAAAERCGNPSALAATAAALSTIDCTETQDMGYSDGEPFAITVVTVDGEKVERDTANAYYVMAQAADRDGVQLSINSAFRTMAEQERLYACYVNCNCNNCNLAAEPGYSNHQSGHALDLNTSAAGVLGWLNARGAEFGFERTVPSEDWHWEWWGGGPGGGPCGVEYRGTSLGISGQSYPIVSRGPVTVAIGETVTGWVKLENAGRGTWQPGVVWLAPIPRDQASAFASDSWQSPTRISTPAADVAPGQVGEFALDITGKVEGESILSLGWVAENETWFADGPRGGGPEDGYFAVAVSVVPGTDTPDAEVPDGGAQDAGVPPVTTPVRDAGARADAGAGHVERDAGGGHVEREAGAELCR
jgi:hypothetical protein